MGPEIEIHNWNPSLVLKEAQVILEEAEKHLRKQIEVPSGVCIIYQKKKTGVCIDDLANKLQVLDMSDNDETPVSFHIGENTPRPTIRKGRRAWKKEAR